MKYFLSLNTLKQQAKLVVKNWPFSPIKISKAQELLCQLYGFKSFHQFKQEIEINHDLIEITRQIVIEQYAVWVKRLADLASINQIQSKNLLHLLWPAYLANQIDISEKLYSSKVKFFGECNDFLDKSLRMQWIEYSFDDRPSVKDTIEALGVPHTEVGAIQIITENGEQYWADFSHLMMNKEKIKVYPNCFLSTTIALPFKPKGKITFLLDVHLGGLARYLRLAGFNCLHESKDYGDPVLAHLASQNDYILLTRDIGLLKRSKVNYGRWVRHTKPIEQFKEVISHYKLKDEVKPFSRCVKCNGDIGFVEKDRIESMVPENIFAQYDDFRQCKSCQQIYWQGGHINSINEILDSLKL